MEEGSRVVGTVSEEMTVSPTHKASLIKKQKSEEEQR